MDEFTRRTDSLRGHDLPGRLVLQAVGAWWLLWTLHSDSTGVVRLDEQQAAQAVGVSIPTWRRLTDVLATAGLLERDGSLYAVPDAPQLEGFAAEHRGPSGWRSTHRMAFHKHAVVPAGLAAGFGHAAGGKRLALLGTFGWVVLRHSRPKGTHIDVDARAELQQMLDDDTVRDYLAVFSDVLTSPVRGRLAFAGRSRLEGAGSLDRLSAVYGPRNVAGSAPSRLPTTSSSAAVPEDITGDAEPVGMSTTSTRIGVEKTEIRPSPASLGLRGQELKPPQPPAAPHEPLSPPRGQKRRHPALNDLVADLERWEPRLHRLRRRPRALQALSDALDLINGNRNALLEQVQTGGTLRSAEYPVQALIRRRLPDAVHELTRPRTNPEVLRTQWQEVRDQELRLASEERAEVERLDDLKDAWSEAITAAYPAAAALRALVAELDLGPVRSHRALEACLRRRVLELVVWDTSSDTVGASRVRTRVCSPTEIGADVLAAAAAAAHEALLLERSA